MTTAFEMTFTATAEVVRGCCGRDHEAGPCPFANETPED